MNSKVLSYAMEMFDDLYGEGDRDIVFFGHILGMVTYDQDDVALGKRPAKRLEDAITLVSYLVSEKDFPIGCAQEGMNGEVFYVPFERGLEGFKKCVTEIFEEKGIDHINLFVGTYLQKTHLTPAPKSLPDFIVDLFKPVRE